MPKVEIEYKKIPETVWKKGCTVGGRFCVFDCGIFTACHIITKLSRKTKFPGVSGLIEYKGKNYWWCLYGLQDSETVIDFTETKQSSPK